MRTPKASNDQNKGPLLEVQMEQSKKQIKTKFTGTEKKAWEDIKKQQ